MAEANSKKPGLFTKVRNWVKRRAKFFRDTKSELKKVVWPTKKQVLNNTAVVLVVVVIASVLILLLDMLFGGIVHGIMSLAAGL